MKFKKKSLIAVAVLLAVLLCASIGALAATNYGTRDDPLVTSSYLNDTVTDSILNKFDTSLAEAEDELTASFEDKLSSGGGSSADQFKLVTLSSGQKLICGVGTELMLRIGTAASYGPDAPRLINMTDGTSVTDVGTEIKTNNMYMVTIKNNGIEATSGTVKILVRGSYSIG